MISERVGNTCVYANDRSDVRPHSTETYRRPSPDTRLKRQYRWATSLDMMFYISP